MRIATPADAIYALIARLPLLMIAALIVWAGYAGLQQLELRSEGTTVLVPAGESVPVNAVAAQQRRTEEDLMTALNSDDVAQMQDALARAEASGVA